ncbi:MAG: alkaline phosphatase family protein [Candidatus Sulfotelmatobacter sp.]
MRWLIKISCLVATLLLSLLCSAQSIDHFILVIKENRSTDELFGTFPGVQSYCSGGHSPLRCTTNQSTSCTTVGTHDVCANGGWCEPLQCTTPNGPECTTGDICPQITIGKQSNTPTNLNLQNSATTYSDISHSQASFIEQLSDGSMNWPSTVGLSYYDQTQIPYLYQLISTYGLADNHFSTMGGPSLPNHAYLFAAASNEISDNPTTTVAGSASNPGNHGGFYNSWTCGAAHSGSTPPYTYTGDMISTQASDGTQYYGGVCTSNKTVACTCKCLTGTKCSRPASCSTDPGCTALSDTCSTNKSIGGNSGAPCLTLTTIADRIEAVLGSGPTSWGYFSNNNGPTNKPSWLAPAYFQNIYFNPTRWANHVYQDTAFDTVVAACTGMCSNNHANACTLDSQCGSGDTCIDSDGTPADSRACTLPKVVYLSPTDQTLSEHPSYGTLASGVAWTQSRLNNYFTNPYIYAHSIVLLTWDDWGGFYDHVPPPTNDNLPTLGFRVPLICIGPYCKNTITHTQFEFASELKCIEDLFGLSFINSRDQDATDSCAGKWTLSSAADGQKYRVDDVLTVKQSGASGGSLQVLAVNGSGAITRAVLLNPGTGYTIANDLSTTGGHGSGATISIKSKGSLSLNIDGMIDTSQSPILSLAAPAAVQPIVFSGGVNKIE